MNNKMKELLQEQTTADQADNSDSNNGVTTSTPNWQREPIPNTPFWIVGNEEKGWNIILGKWKLTEHEIFIGVSLEFIMNNHGYEKSTPIQEHLDTMKWQYILSTIICVTTDIEKQKQN